MEKIKQILWLSALGLLLSILWSPQIIINNQVANHLIKLPIIKDLVSWEKIDIQFFNNSWKDKEFRLKGNNLCLNLKNIKGCADYIEMGLVFFYANQQLSISLEGPIVLQSKEINIIVKAKKSVKKEDVNKSSAIKFNINDLDDVLLDVKKLSIKNNDNKYEFKIFGKNFKNKLSINFEHLSGIKIDQLSTSLEIFNFSLDNKKEVFISGNVKFKHKKFNGDYYIKAQQLDPKKLSFEYGIIGKLNYEDKIYYAWLEGLFKDDFNKINLISELHNYHELVPKINMKTCSLSSKIIFNKKNIESEIDCSISADFNFKVSPELSKIKLPNIAQGNFKSKFSVNYPFNDSSLIQGSLIANLAPMENNLIYTAANINSNFIGNLSDLPYSFTLDTKININSELKKFESLVERLEDSEKYSIPAPFNKLKGFMSLAFEGDLSLSKADFPFIFTTRLNSKNQKFDTDTEGNLSTSLLSLLTSKSFKELKPKLKLKTVLTDIKLALPDLKIETPPRLLLDRRIKKSLIEEKSLLNEINLDYELNLVTDKSPVQIISNLTKAPVPININVIFSKQNPISGELFIGNVPVEIFNRKAFLEKLSISLNGREPPKIDGSLKISYVDYNIQVLLLGNTENPVVKIDSDPPLSQEEVISVLIYGRSISELDSEQQESVNNTRSALADKSLGLASLYFLASTPIESLGYDEETKEFTAKVKLGQGTSLNLGRNNLGSRVGIRRRISKYFTITSEYIQESATTTSEESSGFETLLEWSHRY